MAKPLDLIGMKFVRLTALKIAKRKKGKIYWLCICDCGQKTEVPTEHLRSGNTKSCGCLNIEKISLRFKKHGDTGSNLYDVWKGIKQRCLNPNNKSYAIYGGRGITVYDEWIKSYTVFKKWAHTTGYKKDLQIDRIDNDGPYSPLNCRWVSQVENIYNSRISKLNKEQVLNIRKLFNENSNSDTIRISNKYNVSRATIYNVVNFKTWRNI